MLITTILSVFTLLSGSIFDSSIDFIHKKHLDTTYGRVQFLTEMLIPYLEKGSQLNQEVTALASKIETLSPELDQAEIISKTNELTRKMAELQKMLPIMESASKIDTDFEELENILTKTPPLSEHEKEVLNRIGNIYESIVNSVY